jgi:acyl carrier protein
MKTDEELVLETILAETGQLAASDTTMDALGMQSLDFLELMLRIEDVTGVRIPAAKVQTIERVADIYAALEAERAAVSS